MKTFVIDPKDFSASEWVEMFNSDGDDLLKHEGTPADPAKPVKETAANIEMLALCCRLKADRIRAGELGQFPVDGDCDMEQWAEELESAASTLERIIQKRHEPFAEWSQKTRAQDAVASLKRCAQYITPDRFPGLSKKIRSALKSAEGAVRHINNREVGAQARSASLTRHRPGGR